MKGRGTAVCRGRRRGGERPHAEGGEGEGNGCTQREGRGGERPYTEGGEGEGNGRTQREEKGNGRTQREVKGRGMAVRRGTGWGRRDTHVSPELGQAGDAAIAGGPVCPLVQPALREENNLSDWTVRKRTRTGSSCCSDNALENSLAALSTRTYVHSHARVYSTLVKVLVMRDWMLLLVVLKVLQLWAIRRAAKSRRAQ